MDVRRSCSTTVMFWDAAQTVSSTVRWFFVDDSTPFCPFPHRFSSEIWDGTHWGNPGAGEDPLSTQPYDKGAPPAPIEPIILPGDLPCGPPEWFREGAPSDAPPEVWANGIPACCHGAFRVGACSCSRVRFQGAIIPTSCGACTSNPEQWTLTVSDIVNAGCANCHAADGAGFLLTNIPAGAPNPGGEISNGCYWDTVPLPDLACGGGTTGPYYFELQFSSSDFFWHLYLRAGLEIIGDWGTIDSVSFNCLGPNSFGPPTWVASTCLSSAHVTLNPA